MRSSTLSIFCNLGGSGSGGDEHDEELRRWEDEQIRKGVSIPQVCFILLRYFSCNYF